MNISYTDLDQVAGNIISQNKSTRREAREKFLALTNGGKNLLYDKKDGFTEWKNLIHIVMHAFSLQFPYAIDSNNVRYNRKPINFQASTTPDPKSQLTANDIGYIALMAFGMNPNEDNPHERLSQQLNLLRNEGFETTKEVSNTEAERRLKIIVGMNYAYSIDSRINKVMREHINGLQAEFTNANTKFQAFAWYPRLITNKKITDKEILGSFSTAKRIFRLIREINPKIATSIVTKMYAKKPVPYTYIRDLIKDSQVASSALTQLRRGTKDRVVIAFTCDSDTKSYRTEGLGVLSCYDNMFAANPDLQVASTGYKMSDPHDDCVEVISDIDRTIRAIGLNRIAYFPEPNIGVKIPSSCEYGLGYSYSEGHKASDFTLESDRVLKSLDLKLANSAGHIQFAYGNPILTDKGNAQIPSILKGKLTAADFADAKKIKAFREFRQVCFHPLFGFAHTVLRALPKQGGQKNSGIVQKIYVSYDPIEFAQHFPDCWLDLYYPYFQQLCKSINDDFNTSTLPSKINDILRCVPHLTSQREHIKNYFMNNINQLRDAHQNFRNSSNFTKNSDIFIHHAAMNVSVVLFACLYTRARNKTLSVLAHDFSYPSSGITIPTLEGVLFRDPQRLLVGVELDEGV